LEQANKILEVEDIHTYYGPSYVIQGLSLFLRERESISIIGRNGVGKTTTLRSIIGLTPPKRGSIKVLGHEVRGFPPHKIARMGVAYVPAERHIFPALTVRENLQMAERTVKEDGGDSWTEERIYEEFPILKERAKQDGSTLSGGEQQMLTMARGLMSNPKIMLLDEPSQGLSPVLVAEVGNIIKRCSDLGISIVLVEQNYKMALRLASRHYLMTNKGQITREASAEELIQNPQIVVDHLTIAA
jgi:branched-chain amino acid transport system ATP-binding protein